MDAEVKRASWTTQLADFWKDVRVEFHKVSWPTRSELRDSTIVVIVAVVILTVFVYIVDAVLRMGLGLLLR